MLSGDRRDFRRYSIDSELNLTIQDRSSSAAIFDYSFNGIGAVVEKTVSLNKGDIFEINASSPNISTCGEVIWIRSEKTQSRLGIRHIGNLKGSIRDFRLADVLIGLQRSNRTGVLTVVSGDINKKIYVSNGDMIFAASNQDEDRLGDLLLKEGRINITQYYHSVTEMKKTGQRQGAVLVRLGYLRPEELAAVVTHQVEEIILSLFAIEEGLFIFEDGILSTEEVIKLKLSAATLIYYGTKKLGSYSKIRAGLPPMDSVLCFASDPFDLFQGIKLDEIGRRQLSAIDSRKSISEIIALSQSESFEALKTISALLNTRMVVIKDSLITCEETETVMEKLPDVEPLVRETIEEMYKKYKDIGYYGVLDIDRFSSLSKIKEAYYKAAKKFHPDMHFSLPDASLKNKLNEIFAYIYEAYSTLNNQHKKAEYDRQKPVASVSVQDRARDAFEEGKLNMKKGKYAEAELLFGQAVYFDRSVAKYHYYNGVSIMKRNKFREAARFFEKAIKLDPANPDYMADLGTAFLSLGLHTRAKGVFNKALAIQPGHEKASMGLHEALSKLTHGK